MDDFGLLSDLADRIIDRRRVQIYDDFFDDVSKTTWDKYFKERKVRGRVYSPYLKEGVHGWTYVRKKDGTVQYRMISKNRWARVKRGKKTIPSPSKLTYEKKIADKLIDLNEKKQSFKKGVMNGYEVTLAYEESLPREYKGSYVAENFGEAGNLMITESSGRMSKLDRDILICIREWADKNRLNIVVSSNFSE